MKIIAINGSPRKIWNTATLLTKALEGATAQGAETELIHLYDLDFKGCRSCFTCKIKGGKSYGRCAADDGLTPILRKIENADALIIGSPIYLGSVTGELRSFLERLLYPYLTYTTPLGSLFPKRIATGFIYTMNSTEDQSKERGYEYISNSLDDYARLILGTVESLFSYDTYQFDDYSKVVADRFDPEKKLQGRKEAFPKDCEKAFDMGARFAGTPIS